MTSHNPQANMEAALDAAAMAKAALVPCPFIPENWSENQPSTGCWVEFKHLPLNPNPMTLTEAGWDLFQGILQVDACGKKGDGSVEVRQLASAVADWFPINTAVNVAGGMPGLALKIVKVTVHGAVDDPLCYRRPVSFNYRLTQPR